MIPAPKTTIFTFEQQSAEWNKHKLGVASSSNFHRILAKGSGATRASYMDELLCEMITGERRQLNTEAMERGNNIEPIAKAWYMNHPDYIDHCYEVGFIKAEGGFGCSPDLLISNNGGAEFKCPLLDTHMKYLKANKCPPKYKHQVQGCLWITGREYWKFISYHPSLEDDEQLVVRVERDEALISILEIEVPMFVEELMYLKGERENGRY